MVPKRRQDLPSMRRLNQNQLSRNPRAKIAGRMVAMTIIQVLRLVQPVYQEQTVQSVFPFPLELPPPPTVVLRVVVDRAAYGEEQDVMYRRQIILEVVVKGAAPALK